MSNLSNLLDKRTMPHKDVQICLNLDLLDQRDEAMKAIKPARLAVNDDRLVTPPTKASERVAELEKQIREQSITLRITGVDRITYNQWLVQCPPRRGKQEPFDSTKFFMHAAKNSAVYLDGDTEHEISAEEWAQIDKMLTDGEHDRIAQAVVHVNRSVGAVDVGFFGNDSEMTRDSFGTSAPQSSSESRPAASGAGNRKKSTSKTSTKKADAASE